LIKQHGHERVREAVEEAVILGCSDGAAIRHLAPRILPMRAARTWNWVSFGALNASMTDYDGLLSQKMEQIGSTARSFCSFWWESRSSASLARLFHAAAPNLAQSQRASAPIRPSYETAGPKGGQLSRSAIDIC
jgi:hypothetical protein